MQSWNINPPSLLVNMIKSLFNPPSQWELKDNNFSYTNLCKLKEGEKIISSEYSYSAKHESGHIFLLRKEENPRDLIFSRIRGYKFHISIHTGTPNNLANAWNIIFTILNKYALHQFKILDSNSDAKHTHGKEVTIYAFQNRMPLAEWEIIITELTQGLAQAGIIPSAHPDSDTGIPNTNYVSYRNDGDSLFSPDPYANLKVESKIKQPERAQPNPPNKNLSC